MANLTLEMQRARVAAPALQKALLSNLRLDYEPTACLVQAHTSGAHAARALFNDLAGVDPDADILFIRLKQVIASELPAPTLASLRTFCRAVQLHLVGAAS